MWAYFKERLQDIWWVIRRFFGQPPASVNPCPSPILQNSPTTQSVADPPSIDEFKYKTNSLEPFYIDPTDPESPERAWSALQRRVPTLSGWGVDILRKALDGFVQSIVLEPHYNCKDHRNLFTHFYSKKFMAGSPECSRLHFFKTSKINTKRMLTRPDEFQNDYLGFSIIRPVAERCLGRTILNPYGIGRHIDDNFFLIKTPFAVQISGQKYVVEGYPYTSQDADATLCAHSALWTVCRYLSERYKCYKELYPYDFIRMTESGEGRAVPYRGMTYTDYCRILSEFGTFPVYRALQLSGKWDPEAFEDICAYVESGFPALASLRNTNRDFGHVVNLIGHTLDYQRPTGSSEFVSSSVFLKQFIVMDDNTPPYSLLGYAGDFENYGKEYQTQAGEEITISSMQTVTCPLPEKVFLPAKDARMKAMTLAKKCLDEIRRTGSGPYVTRLFVTTGASLQKRKLDSVTASPDRPDRASTLVTNLHLPHFVWIMEISPLNLYKLGECTAEIVMDATAGVLDEGLIYSRIGNKLTLAGKKQAIDKVIDDAPVRFRQYTHNLGEKRIA
jgi:hypothetical protein